MGDFTWCWFFFHIMTLRWLLVKMHFSKIVLFMYFPIIQVIPDCWRAWPHSRSAIVSPPGPKFQSCLYSVSSWDPICNPIFPILKKMQFVRQKLEIPINPWTPIMEQLITGQWRHQAIYLSMIARFPGFFLTKNRENPENLIAYRKYDIISRYSQNIDSIGIRARVGKRLHS